MDTSKQKKASPFFNDISPIITPKSNISSSFMSNKDTLTLNMNSCLRVPPKSLSSREMTSSKKDFPNVSKTHTTTNESFSMDQKQSAEVYKYNSTYESLHPAHKESSDREEETKLDRKFEQMQIIEYEEFSPEDEKNQDEIIIPSSSPDLGNKSLREKEEPMNSGSNKENENLEKSASKEFYVKHLLNEIRKYSTCARSYKAENESLKEKLKFLHTKMSIKDQKIEEITKLLRKSTTDLPDEKINENYKTQIEHCKSLIEAQKLALDEKERQKEELAQKMNEILTEFNKISNENSQLRIEIAGLKGQVGASKNMTFLMKNQTVGYENKLKEQMEKEEKILQKLDGDLKKIGSSASRTLSPSPFNSSENFFNNKVSKAINNIKEDMMRTFFTAKADGLKYEEMSMTERIKERQNHKSKSIMDDPKYKDIVNGNSNQTNGGKNDGSGSKQTGKSNGRSTSSFNSSNASSYNNYSININNNFNNVKNYRMGLDAPQNRINRLADSLSFRARQNQLNSIKNKLYDMNSLLLKAGDIPSVRESRKDPATVNVNKISTINNFELAGQALTKTYNSER